MWRGKPIFVKHRTPEDIKRENSVNVAELRHAQPDAERVVDENWLVVIGICTHLGCVPIDNAGMFTKMLTKMRVFRTVKENTEFIPRRGSDR